MCSAYRRIGIRHLPPSAIGTHSSHLKTKVGSYIGGGPPLRLGIRLSRHRKLSVARESIKVAEHGRDKRAVYSSNALESLVRTFYTGSRRPLGAARAAGLGRLGRAPAAAPARPASDARPAGATAKARGH